MSTYEISNKFGKIGDIYLMSGMTLRSKGSEGPCDFVFGRLYIYPKGVGRATLVSVGDEVEVVSISRNMQVLEDRKNAIVHRQLSWQDRIGEENTRSFDPSNESW